MKLVNNGRKIKKAITDLLCNNHSGLEFLIILAKTKGARKKDMKILLEDLEKDGYITSVVMDGDTIYKHAKPYGNGDLNG